MLCQKPFMAGAVPFGCGQCLPCRINKRRQWMWRQYLEALMHKENCFVTLTYADDQLPEGGNLTPSHLQGWLKRLRARIAPVKVRFFAVGEYGGHEFGGRGSRGVNPHYHVSLFGVSGRSDWSYIGRERSCSHFGVSGECQLAWPYGDVFVAEFNERTATYVAGYTTKKMTAAGDIRLKGRHPEFMRSSRRPGLGVEAMRVLAARLLEGPGLVDGDVPHQLLLGKKSIPLGRFLLAKARGFAGMSDEQIRSVKERVSVERSLELLSLFAGDLEREGGAWTPSQTYQKEVAQRIRQSLVRYQLWERKDEKV